MVRGLDARGLGHGEAVAGEPRAERGVVAELLDVREVVVAGDAPDERGVAGGLDERGHGAARPSLVDEDGRRRGGDAVEGKAARGDVAGEGAQRGAAAGVLRDGERVGRGGAHRAQGAREVVADAASLGDGGDHRGPGGMTVLPGRMSFAPHEPAAPRSFIATKAPPTRPTSRSSTRRTRKRRSRSTGRRVDSSTAPVEVARGLSLGSGASLMASEAERSPSARRGTLRAVMDESRGRILIVDDEANARAALSEILREEGYETETAADGFKALGKLGSFSPDLILTDLKMPGLDGLGLLKEARAASPSTVLVVMTAFGTIDSRGRGHQARRRELPHQAARARRARRGGRARHGEGAAHGRGRRAARAPPRAQRLRAHRRRAPEHEGDAARPSRRWRRRDRACSSSARAAPARSWSPRALHRASPRAQQPFVRLNCAALSETLLESELFGHERGAFTGAVGRREGRFEQADGGTLFLDEIGEIPLATQVKLLRVLQEREFERVGGNETLKVDVRIIAATNGDLEDRVRRGQFREDLFYRLNVIRIELPPLRERRTDIAAARELLPAPLRAGERQAHRRLHRRGAAAAHGVRPGRATCASSRTPSSARWCSAAASASRSSTSPADRPSARRERGTGDGRPRDPRVDHRGARALRHPRDAARPSAGPPRRRRSILGISPRKIQYKLHEYGRVGPVGEGESGA